MELGIAMDNFPEVNKLLLPRPTKKVGPHLYIVGTQVAIHSFMWADGLTYEDAFNYYYN